MTKLQIILAVLCLLAARAEAVFLPFDNCLPDNIKNSDPLQLQFVPMYLDAKFDASSPDHTLNITVYGNVTGQATEGDYPPPNSPQWDDPTNPFGKILNVSNSDDHPTFSTLYAKADVLSYRAWDLQKSAFCDAVVHGECPLGPSFHANSSDPSTLSSFAVTHSFFGSYSFATLALTISVVSGAENAPLLTCVSTNVTPYLGSSISDTLLAVPIVCLILSAVATIFVAMFSPWSSSDPFKWTSNYGRDEDILRLVTPGFSDVLQYIQYIVLAGGLSLSYPGFFQPVVSKASWSALLFHQGYVSKDAPKQNVVDGMFISNGTYGLDRLGDIIGFADEEDIWAGMTIWLLGITAIIVVLCQLAFAIRWSVIRLSKLTEEDLRSKNLPFTGGVVVRILMNYFFLPIVAISLFQLVIAPTSPVSVVAGAVILLVVVLGLGAWISYFILTAKPRAHLFDDLQTLLFYGPLYNTYSDNAASYAVIMLALTFTRGVAFGAIQPSGVAQVVVLAACEIIHILTLQAFRPYFAPTSMNIYHILISAARLLTTLLMIAFVPALGVSEPAKGWVGYAILLIHAIVLIGAFLLNSIQKIIEVTARLAGAGGEARGGLTKVFGKRQLSRRNRRDLARDSRGSTATMLGTEKDNQSVQMQMMSARSRSLSASSALLLNQTRTSDARTSSAFDNFSQLGDLSGSATPGGTQSAFSFVPGGTSGPGSRRATIGSKILDVNDPYYRPPRPRKAADDTQTTPGALSRASWMSGDWTSRVNDDSPTQADIDAGEGPSSASPARRGSSPPQTYLRNFRDDSDPNLADGAQPTDYTVRESDFYYGISRGPALSHTPTRRLRTGPADPTGPVSSAAGWFRDLLGGKRKDKSKGFEVVRSTRAPPPMVPLEEDEDATEATNMPYSDDPRFHDAERQRAGSQGDITTARRGVKRVPLSDSDSHSDGSDNDSDDYDSDDFDQNMGRISKEPPALAPFEFGGSIELPSRYGSQASHRAAGASRHTSRKSSRRHRREKGDPTRTPTIPRKSSRRKSSLEPVSLLDAPRLSTVADAESQPTTPRISRTGPTTSGAVPQLAPPATSQSTEDPLLLRPTTAGSQQNQFHALSSSHRIPFAGSGEHSPSAEERPSPSLSAQSAVSSLFPNGEGLVDQQRQPGTSSAGAGRGAVINLPPGQAAVSMASGAAATSMAGSGSGLGIDHGGQPIASGDPPPMDLATDGRGRSGTASGTELRPASMGYVHHHVAGDSIHRGQRRGPASNLGSSAEVVRSKSGSSAGTQRSEES